MGVTPVFKQFIVVVAILPYLMLIHFLLSFWSMQETPFVMEVDHPQKDTDSDELVLEGLCIDLLEELSIRLGFTYEIYLVSDSSYGTEVHNDTSNHTQWNGLIGDIMREVTKYILEDIKVIQPKVSEKLKLMVKF